jgi:hypothetical protein
MCTIAGDIKVLTQLKFDHTTNHMSTYSLSKVTIQMKWNLLPEL